MSTTSDRSIDIHGHYGEPVGFPQRGRAKECLRISLDDLEATYRENNMVGCFSPLEALFIERDEELLRANESACSISSMRDWFYQWVVIHPHIPQSFEQAAAYLAANPKCVGVKIHPDAHGYAIGAEGDRIFRFCAEHGCILEAHSGDRLSLPADILALADNYPAVRVIIAHCGYCYDGSVEAQVEAVCKARHGNIYTDTSSVKSILANLIEWAYVAVPQGRLLFGTDTPLHHAPMMKARISCASLAERDKERILCGNARELLGMASRETLI